MESTINAREIQSEVSFRSDGSDEEYVEASRKAGLTRGAHQVTCEASFVKLSAQA